MFKFLPYTLKTLWRHRSRTVLTVSGSAVALFVYCFVGSVQEGINDLQRRQVANGALVAFQANKFCPATSHLPEDYDQQIASIDGVRQVMPIQVFTNNCRASLDVVIFYGVPPKKLRQTRDFKLLSGSWSEFEQHQGAAIVGRMVAARRGIEVGDKFSIGDLSVDVAGIYQSADSAEENYIYSHLEFLQRGKGMNLVGTVTQIEVLLDKNTDPLKICNEIDDKFRGGPVETDTRPKGVFQTKALGDLMQLIGMANYLALVMTESIVLSFVGGVLGVGTALLTLKLTNFSVGAEAVSISFTPSVHLATTGLLVSLVAGMLAGIAPALHAARTEIVPALRTA